MMTKHFFLVAALPLVGVLAACSSSGGAGSASFDELARQGNALASRLENADPTPVANMPSSGSATYRGIAAYSDTPNAEFILENGEIVSQVELNADFSSGAVDGKLTNFRWYDNDRIAGSVDIRNGSIEGNELYADLSGSLTYGDGAEDVRGDLAGIFAGQDAGAVVGAMEGRIGSEDFYAIFGAER